ncbi:MAG TPA: L-2-amino-thiazoline-4-carboxylic acid hydrolase, partial [Emticicia sp.]
PDGFVAHIITNKKETNGLGYGVDIIECGICKLFKKHNYQKYVSILCEVDKYTTNLAGLSMIRTDTIANGAGKCDFRYKLQHDVSK